MKRRTERTDAHEQHELPLEIPRRNDSALVAAIQYGDERALHEFCERFRPLLLDQARRLGVTREVREHTVMEFLDDFALRIAIGEVSFTASSFVVKAFRNRVVDQWRKDHRETSLNTPDDAMMLLSEFAVQSSYPTAGDGLRTSSATDLMVRYLLSQCTSTERNLVVWASHGVPLRLIAEWIGISYSAVKVRWFRLRNKLQEAAVTYADSLTEPERGEIERFLRYAGVHVPSDESVIKQIGGEGIHA